MPKQGSSTGFKYGRAVGAIEAAITCAGSRSTIVEPSAWKRFRTSRRRQGRWTPARAAALSRRPRAARAQERSRSRRGVVDRALRGQVIMNAPLEPAHSPFGGSVAARVLRCPASVGLIEKVPAHLRKVLSLCRSRHGAPRGNGSADRRRSAPSTSLAGKTFNGYTITPDDVENALRPAYAYVEALLDTPGAEYYLEQRVVFPTIAGAFGTADLHRPHRRHDLRHRFQVWHRRARPRALS